MPTKMPEHKDSVYRSPTTGVEYNIHPTLLETGALQALVERRGRLLYEFGDSSALIEGYGVADDGSMGNFPYRNHILLVALRFAPRFEIRHHIEADQPPDSMMWTTGVGLGASAAMEALTLLRTTGGRWEVVVDQILSGHRDEQMAERLLSGIPVLDVIATGSRPTKQTKDWMLHKFSLPDLQALDHRSQYGYRHPGGQVSFNRGARGEMPDQRLALARIIV